jgi:predicted DNA-binding transcriptional regulator AlpA
MYQQHDLVPAPSSNGTNPTDSLMTVQQVADYLRINKKRVYTLPIPQVRLSDRRVRFLSADVTAYVYRNRRGA